MQKILQRKCRKTIADCVIKIGDWVTSTEKAFRIVGVTKLDSRRSELHIECDSSKMPEECTSWYGTISFNTTITEIGMQSIPARVSILADMVVRPTTIVLSSDQPETNVILAFKGDSQRGIQPWSVNTGNTSVTVDPPEMVSEGVYVFKVKKVDGSSTKGDLKITHSTREQFSVRIPVSFFEGDQ